MTVPLNLTSPKVPLKLSAAAPDPQELTENDFAWLSITGLLKRRLPLILVVMIATALAALPLILTVRTSYSAQARVLLSPSQTVTLTRDTAERASALDVDTEIERLWSRDMAQAVIDRLGLAQLEEFNARLNPPGLLARWFAKDDPGGPAAAARTEALVRAAFQDALGISRQGTTPVVTLSFKSRDPALAAAVPNTLAEIYAARGETRWSEDVAQAAEWLDRRITADRTRLQATQAALAALRDKAGPVTDEPSARLALREGQRSDLARERLDLEDRLAQIAAAEQNPDTRILSDNTAIEALQGELQNGLREVEAITSTYGEKYDGVASRRARIDSIRSQLSAALGAYRQTIAARVETLAQRDAALETEIAALRRVLDEQHRTEPEIDRLSKVAQDQGAALSLLEYRRQVLAAQGQIAPVHLEVLSPAIVPVHPDGLGRKILLLGSLAAGMMFGLTLAGIAELRDNGVRSHEQLVHLPQLIPAGLLPSVRPRTRWFRKGPPPADEADRTEALRDAIFMIECAAGGVFPSSLLVTGTAEDETAVAQALAQALGASGRRVLLVRSEAAPAPRPPPDPPAPLLRRVVKDAHGGLSWLTIGADLAGSATGREALQELLRQAEAEGLVTILAGPPLHRGDALRLGQLVQGTLLVLHWGRTPRRLVELYAGLLAKARITRTFCLIVEADPVLHRQYGFTDRMSLPAPHAAL